MEVTALKWDGNNLAVRGAIMGAMPVTCVLTPKEARGALKLVGFSFALFLVSLLFRP